MASPCRRQGHLGNPATRFVARNCRQAEYGCNMNDTGKILAVDDVDNIRNLIRNEFSLEGFDVTTASSGEEALKLIDRFDFDVVLLDIKLPKMNGIETLERMKQKSPATEVIMITGYGDIRSAVESIKLGARDYVTKPFKLDVLIAIVRQAVKEKNRRFGSTGEIGGHEKEYESAHLWCPSPAMSKIYESVSRIAPSDFTVLITGETGVGKDVLAYQIHQKSLRKRGPFVILDCGLLAQNLAESELYGHRKGAFSGASEAKTGLVEKSHNGTLFLDEVGNIDLDVQKKFLRFIETKRIRRIGETREIQVDTRIILATNRNLEKAMEMGDLRSDLFYRMAAFTISIPPLRDRVEGIIPLAQHFLDQIAFDNGPIGMAPEVDDILVSYPWPGNVRELKSIISKASLMASSDTIMPDDLPQHIRSRESFASCRAKTLEEMEKDHIMAILAETGGNQTKASEVLGINRKTLYKKIKKYKILS